jgi:signal transduction histidine kinase
MLDARLVPEFGPDGRVTAVLSDVRDITELHRAQQQEFHLALERERLNLLTRFVQTAAHEFRNPLAVIGTSAHIMSRSDDPERRMAKAYQIEAQVMRLAHLVEMLLLTVKLENGHPLALEPLNLAELVAVACTNITAKYPDGPPVQCDVPANLPRMQGHADYLVEAMTQLLDNACRYTPVDGQVILSVAQPDSRCIFTVTDTGHGIGAEALPHVFETFWRADTAHSTPGFGLGLPIARKIARLHGGDISVDSTPGAGSRFYLVLPGLAINP